ncbi:hypothetical protein BRADI_3g60316v3 [Brachypodium distachyon]|uniref:Terpene synthase n=1 Tax=Brachypodium distachyon TaxID=15368 RepID=A0A0Q3I8H6_BRADI|nr:hypothetical protein BRADI_3g60316v3 [Brachypodium distachyon]
MSMQRSEEWMRARADKLKEEVQMLFNTCSSTMDRITLLDALQHLGIDHHFVEQINTALQEIVGSEFSSSILHEVALRFRLLREHGFWVSPDVFDKFKSEDGSFSGNEPRGLLSLYNAAHLLIHGEPSMEVIISLVRHDLESMKDSLKPPLAEQVKRALHLPLPRTFKRVETLHYISEYKQEDGYNPNLLELAKLDFNLLQRVHLKELKAITEWWEYLYGHVGLKYVRDRVVECYTWSYALFHEEGFALARISVAKQMVLITIMDDTYDNHATIQECRQLNEAVQRWDDSAISLLPEYLKRYYSELLRFFEQFEGEVATADSYRIAYVKKEFQHLSTYFMEEAEWFHRKHEPSFEEQVKLSSMSITLTTLCMGSIAAMGDAVTKETLDWAATFPQVIMASSKIARFMNDIASFERGKIKGDAMSSVECYMSEHGLTREVAIARMESMMEEEWKTTNQARFDEDRVLLPAVQRVINFAVSMPVFYGGRKDAYSSCSLRLRDTILSLFVTPIPMQY